MKRKPAFADVPADKQDEAKEWIAAGKPRPETRSAESESLEADPVLIPTSLRLPQTLNNRLDQASLRRKIARKKPWKRQEIIANALAEWLDRDEQVNK